MGCWLNFGLRLVLAPAFVAKAVLQIPFSYTREEPSRSDAWGAGASLAAASGSSQATNGKAHAASAAGLPGTSQPLTATLIGKPEFQLVLRRIVDMWSSMPLLLYTALPYNMVFAVVKLLGAGVYLTWLEPHMQRFLSMFIGKYKLEKPTPDGQREVLFSLTNSVDTNFALPMGYTAFPFSIGAQPNDRKAEMAGDAQRAHLCSMAAKLAYEDPLIVADAIERWGFKFLADQQADHESSTVPETYWYAFYNAHAVIICFRGTSPLNLLNWQTDVDLGMSSHPGYGQVHDGFFEALFGRALHKRSLREGFSTSPETVFGAAFQAMTEERVAGKEIYICGHSLGGALSSVFAMALTIRNPGLTARIGGVLTFGQPLVGDADFADIFDDKLGRITQRYVHASDVVPRVPAGLGYVHHGTLRFIPSFDVSDMGRVPTNNDQMEVLQDCETRLGVALTNGVVKLFRSQSPPQESALHTLVRGVLLLLPGVLDHFPGVYEALLRAAMAISDGPVPPGAQVTHGSPSSADVEPTPCAPLLLEHTVQSGNVSSARTWLTASLDTAKAGSTAYLLYPGEQAQDTLEQLRTMLVAGGCHCTLETPDLWIFDYSGSIIEEKPWLKRLVNRLRGGGDDSSTGSSVQPQQCGDGCAAIRLQPVQDPDASSISYVKVQQLLQLTFAQQLQLGYSKHRPVPAHATVVLQLAACREAGQTCIKVPTLSARLQDDAPSGHGKLQDVQVSNLAAKGIVLRDFTIELRAAKQDASSNSSSCSSSTQAWQLSSISPPPDGKPLVCSTRDSLHNYHKVVDTRDLSAQFGPEFAPGPNFKLGWLQWSKHKSISEQPTYKRGDPLDVDCMEVSGMPLKDGSDFSTPTTLTTWRNITMALMAGMQTRELLAIMCKKTSTQLTAEDSGAADASGLTILCSAAVTALLLPDVDKHLGKGQEPHSVRICKREREARQFIFGDTAEMVIPAAGPPPAAAVPAHAARGPDPPAPAKPLGAQT